MKWLQLRLLDVEHKNDNNPQLSITIKDPKIIVVTINHMHQVNDIFSVLKLYIAHTPTICKLIDRQKWDTCSTKVSILKSIHSGENLISLAFMCCWGVWELSFLILMLIIKFETIIWLCILNKIRAITSEKEMLWCFPSIVIQCNLNCCTL